MTAAADRYRRRADRFQALVEGADPAGWEDRSPCTEWSARDVVGHIVFMHQVMLAPLGRSLSPAPLVEEDPVGAFLAARADLEQVLGDDDLLTTTINGPTGPTTVDNSIDGVVSTDLVLHGWDLARATGQDDTIDPAEVDGLWPGVSAMGEEMRTPEFFGPGIVVFGPIVPVPDDAPLQDRLIGMLGRDPQWQRPVPSR